MQAPGKAHPWRTRAHKHNSSPSVQHGWQIVLAIGPTGGTPSQRRPLSGIYVGLDMCQISGAVRTMRWKRRRSAFFLPHGPKCIPDLAASLVACLCHCLSVQLHARAVIRGLW